LSTQLEKYAQIELLTADYMYHRHNCGIKMENAFITFKFGFH